MSDSPSFTTNPAEKSPQENACNWHYAQEGTKHGPVPWPQLREYARQSALKPSDLVLKTGEQKWSQAAELDGLFFWEDLKKVYREIKTPEDFIPLLSKRFKINRARRQERCQKFFADLRAAFNQLRQDHPEQHLPILVDRFGKWRQQTKGHMQQYLVKLRDDDPLYCPMGLFSPMNFTRLETAQTHVLAWLLNPQKEHGFGSRLIETLLLQKTEGWLMGSVVVSEVRSEHEIKLGGEKGRLDVFAKGTWLDKDDQQVSWTLVIEAKIDAGEGDGQLGFYDRWLNQQGAKEEIKVFLTPDGKLPETAKSDWSTMSFLELACSFRHVLEELRGKPGYHFLKHYLTGILKDICHWDLPLKNADACQDPYALMNYLKIIHQR